MASTRGTNFKSITIGKDIQREGQLDVVIYVGTVKIATFQCPENCIKDIILANL